MKRFLSSFRTVLLVLVFCLITRGHAQLILHDLYKPDNPWEHLSPDIDGALDLIVQTEKGVVTNTLRIYVKNVSQTTKTFGVFGSDNGVQILYLDGNANPTELHKPNSPIIADRVFQQEIPHGESICVVIPISDEEIRLLKPHPVKFAIVVVDPTTKKVSKLESTPKLLTETSNK